jgi:hypothetical protein
LQIEGGPSVNIPGNYEVQAYDKVSVVIPHDGIEKKATIQPSGQGQVQFMIIESNKYDESEEAQPKLFYKIEGDTTNKTIKLDRAQFLTGKSFVGLLPAVPKVLLFTNNLDSDAMIEILTGRNALA